MLFAYNLLRIIVYQLYIKNQVQIILIML